MKKIVMNCLMVTFLGGCATTGVISNKQNLTAPANPPKIIYGQKAVIYNASPYAINAWKNTGLFSSVESTSSDTPPVDGVLIVESCELSTKSDRGGEPLKFLWFITIGIIPWIQDNDYYCHTRFYQNGLQLTDASHYVTWTSMSGWMALAYDSAEAKANDAQITVNVVLNELSKKRK